MKQLLLSTLLLTLVACQPSGSVNTAPVVKAGSDISVVDADNDGMQTIKLNASATDAESNIGGYQVIQKDKVLFAGIDASTFQKSIDLPVGTHTLLFIATDIKGLAGTDTLTVEVKEAPANTAPVVNAGADFIVIDTDGDGSQNVKLGGSATDAENNIVKYLVHKSGQVHAGGSVPFIFIQEIPLPVGTHTMTLEATDALGLKGSDTVVITVKPQEITNTAPVVNAGADFSVIDTDNNGSHTVKLRGSASDAQNNIVKYRVHKNGETYAGGTVPFIFIQEITLPVGSHTMTFEATDAGGLVGSDTVVITVNKPQVVNTAPVVAAGSDVSRTDTDNNGSEMITLAGSASDAQNNISSYRVLRNGTQILSGSSASIFTQSISVPVGSHTIVMEASDSAGLKGTDTMLINVAAAPTPPPSSGTPPVANAGPDLSPELVDFGNKTDMITINGSAIAGSNPIVSYTWKINSIPVATGLSSSLLTNQRFPFIKGNNLLELEVVDSAGRKSVDQAIVLVKPSLSEPTLKSGYDYKNQVDYYSSIQGVLSISTGGQKIAIDNDNDGFENVRMTAAVTSTVPMGWFVWRCRGVILAEGADPSILTTYLKLPYGVNPIGLTIYKTSAKSAFDVVAHDSMSVTVSKPMKELIPSIPSNFDRNLYLGNGGAGPAHWKDNSAFRFQCKPSHLLFDDPIVFPGQPGKSHLHMFFGNTMANGNSTYESLRTSGESTCDGGPLNRSAYWMPAVTNENGKVALPDYITIYYKTHPGGNTLPRGLRMVFGFDHRLDKDSALQHRGKWKCSSGGGKFDTIAEVDCPPTNERGEHLLMAELGTPTCWDGVNLDSPDHRSHVSYPQDPKNGWGYHECPATHPVQLTAFTMIVAFSHTGKAEYSQWRLASDHIMAHDSSSAQLPGGSTMHADWFGAWDDDIMKDWHDGCFNQFLSCSGGNTGNGPLRGLKRDPKFSWTTVPRLIDPPMKPMPGK